MVVRILLSLFQARKNYKSPKLVSSYQMIFSVPLTSFYGVLCGQYHNAATIITGSA